MDGDSFWRFKGIYRTSLIPIALAIVFLPISLPIFIFLLPALAIFGFWWLSSYNARHARALEIDMQALHAAREEQEKEQNISIAAKASSRSSPPKSTMITSSSTTSTPPQPTKETTPTATTTSSTPSTKSTTTAPTAVGGGAILARLKAQRAAKAAAAASKRPTQNNITVIYASETGTAAEIAKTIHAGALSRGLQSHVASMNEIGFDAITKEKTPIVIFVASSTGDGDCPSNAAKFYATIKRKTLPTDRLQGIQFTCLGLGDSNYTRFMYVPRQLRTRFRDLGAVSFYECGEADEVDGLEEIVDKWMEGLWPALMAIAKESTTGGDKGSDTSNTTTNNTTGLTLPPPPPPPQIKIEWITDDDRVNTIRKQEKQEYTTTSNTTTATVEYSAETPFYAKVSDSFYLTTEYSHPDRRVIHLDLDITNSGIQYAPGDAIGVLPCNDSVLVNSIITRLKLDGNAVLDIHPITNSNDNNTNSNDSNDTTTTTTTDNNTNTSTTTRALPHVPTPCTLHTALSHGFDLTTPAKKSLLRLLAEHCTNPTEKERLLLLCSKQGRDEYTKEILVARPTLYDLLQRYPSCQPPIDALFDALPALPPRMYSVACSPAFVPHHIHVAFTVVEHNNQYQNDSSDSSDSSHGNGVVLRRGVATGWMEGLLQPFLLKNTTTTNTEEKKESSHDIYIPIFLRKGGDFKTPTDLSCPWIMIGPGTGVAPFRGFLQERKHAIMNSNTTTKQDNDIGSCVLYFGCRRKDQDYLYQNDFESFLSDGTLTQLHVAFSRAQEKKVYVQHLMKQHAKELYDMIMVQNGYVFVCGDGAAMAKDVHAALVEIIAQHGGEGMSEELAQKELMRLAKEGKYVRDIWS